MTPLSFAFRAMLYVGVLVVVIIYSPLSLEFKERLILILIGIFACICVAVGVFTWCRPRNLLYGEAGHRAERRMEVGTERRTLTEQELLALPLTENPRAVPERH